MYATFLEQKGVDILAAYKDKIAHGSAAPAAAAEPVVTAVPGDGGVGEVYVDHEDSEPPGWPRAARTDTGHDLQRASVGEVQLTITASTLEGDDGALQYRIAMRWNNTSWAVCRRCKQPPRVPARVLQCSCGRVLFRKPAWQPFRHEEPCLCDWPAAPQAYVLTVGWPPMGRPRLSHPARHSLRAPGRVAVGRGGAVPTEAAGAHRSAAGAAA